MRRRRFTEIPESNKQKEKKLKIYRLHYKAAPQNSYVPAQYGHCP
jgi:hypothetical protein